MKNVIKNVIIIVLIGIVGLLITDNLSIKKVVKEQATQLETANHEIDELKSSLNKTENEYNNLSNEFMELAFERNALQDKVDNSIETKLVNFE